MGRRRRSDLCKVRYFLYQRVLTGFVGREEMMLSIESRRSGYISARRTSRSVLMAEAMLAGFLFFVFFFFFNFQLMKSKNKTIKTIKYDKESWNRILKDRSSRLTSRFKISRTVKAQDGYWRLQSCFFTLPCRCHCQMTTSRPSYYHYSFLINRDPSCSHYCLQFCLCPCICITHIRDRAVDEVCLWAEPVVDADG